TGRKQNRPARSTWGYQPVRQMQGAPMIQRPPASARGGAARKTAVSEMAGRRQRVAFHRHKRLRPLSGPQLYIMKRNAGSEALVVLHEPEPTRDVPDSGVERVGKRLERDGRILLEHVVDTDADGAIPRRVPGTANIVDGHTALLVV